MELLALKIWSPYVVGAGIGVLSWFTFLLSNKPIGCSTAFARTSGMIEQAITGKSVAKNPYYQKFPAVIDWEWMFVLGIIVGSLVSAMLSGVFFFKVDSFSLDGTVWCIFSTPFFYCIDWWYCSGDWSSLGRWLYQWSWYQRYYAIGS